MHETLQTPLGALVIESPADSGSLITAREAGEQGHEVFAIPGPIDTGKRAGCHKLIQDGAKLVHDIDDILEELGVLTRRTPDAERPTLASSPAPVPNLTPEQRRILDMLTLLEMRGPARRVPGNAFVRVL